MELVQDVMKGVLCGNSVRMGTFNQLPVFSLTDALNLTAGLRQNDEHGRRFVKGPMKNDHTELYERIIFHKFPSNARRSPCMSFPNILLTLAKANAPFSDQLHGIAVAGVVSADAGDEGLVRYVLNNASLDTEHHDIMQKILWAEENPSLAMQGNEAVGEEDDGDTSEVCSILCAPCGLCHRQ